MEGRHPQWPEGVKMFRGLQRSDTQCPEGTAGPSCALKGIKMAFIHNAIMPYRRPFFERLDLQYDMDLILVDPGVTTSVYGVAGDDGQLRPTVLTGPLKYIRMARALLRGEYDIIVDSLERRSILSFLISRVTGIPVLYWSEEWGEGKAGLANSLLFPLSKFVARHADGVLVPGSNHKAYFVGNGVAEDRITVMPNASNMEFRPLGDVKRSELKAELNIGEKSVILYVGRLVRQKGVEYLLQALSEMPPTWVLVVVGEGENKVSLVRLSQKLGIADDVRFLGRVDNEDLFRYYHLSDVVVVPSTTIGGLNDAWVFVLNEAMLFGRAVIATKAVGAAPDMVVEGENGFIVPERDALSLRKALERTIVDGESERMGKKSSERISHFTYDTMVDAFDRAVAKIHGDSKC